VGDDAESGFVRSGYLLLGGDRDVDGVVRNLEMQQALGIETQRLSLSDVAELHPHLHLDDVAVAAWEPHSGWADPYLTASSFFRGARLCGMTVRLGATVTGLRRAGSRVVGVEVDGETIAAGHVVSALNVWSGVLAASLGIALPLAVEKHSLASFRIDTPYGPELPVVKDLIADNKLYFRPGSGGVVLVGGGDAGESVTDPDQYDEGVRLDDVARQGERLVHRLPAYANAVHVNDWSGLYDVTPDWNPVIGPLPGIYGLTVAFGFSGHGFKLAPAIGEALAARLTGKVPAISLDPYAFDRFVQGRPLTGRYGAGSIS
jgi:sarcosine oxidase subunit beta